MENIKEFLNNLSQQVYEPSQFFNLINPKIYSNYIFQTFI